VRSLRSEREARRLRAPQVLEEPELPPVPPVVPIPPSPPLPGKHPTHPTTQERDAERMAREVEKQVRGSVSKAGTLGLITGARVLEKSNRPDRAQEILRRSRDPLARLELFLLQRRRGRPTEADAELRAFASSMTDEDWPRPLLRAYLGEAKDDAALAAATDDDERCEAFYYLGRLHAPADPALARRQLEKAADSSCDQADFAREELQALQSR
jgi:hypothetical protein